MMNMCKNFVPYETVKSTKEETKKSFFKKRHEEKSAEPKPNL
jgi:hypothetical protein